MKKFFQKFILLLLMVGITLTSFANCFGKFSLTRKVYAFNEGIGGGDWAGKIIRTLLMYVYFFFFIGGLVFFIDIVILNLIEFWTDSNPLGLNEYNKEGKYVKSFSKDGETLKLTYINFGQKLYIDMSNGEKSEQLVVLRSEKGKFFKEKDDKLEEVSIDSINVGSKMILRMATNGKLESSKVVETKDFKQLESKYAGEIY
ncbi:MAG TPA: DUF3332 family protein [Leptospiraceae bacterium]|nr:DUF3332 family protein [Leptospiraceae bacterium]HMW08229.1 DUF3332 family protein [Leptospiraceae bacterium]HMX35460.1 DUF3332 family protein [Leptospiraceae bacterium]HMY29670.1 DUF3332 family protein [Leptospiraceae bacterium]HMZ66167.1 DUF3332 family protein [Leptospiraceae bacterium]